ncbi:protein of unknown function - conserved [Leishmania donovani]|uniref:Uncharacterized protein n=3 Tax=Leishmania donovani species complex TaxID=38574 RepID=A4IDR9_LEIIN|nr:conserved hypothetical protein [Leishmania infantum JPCM5]AYU83870.1 hypothetical protein LdCL_360058600 [Leishmania donovani]CAC9552223.1 hypothetical_protein_-_conserved [Leishmania infantum]TPP41955.1 hypothetical protein CGC20_27485 [Leishmania donovani]CAJ1993888.1 protein of unknown function - conserved [Leishmania donovani]CAM73002.1 conserved hypothetical protein [Leishmania infantum JPCM5]|eukprot:XP_001469888.1 conserved hypothetical protein [Leishmania infantum JPCM5]
MPLPPVESGPAAMTRRNFLVEMNRLRVSQYMPTRKQLEEEDLRIATIRQEEKRAKHAEWAESRRKAADSYNAAGTNSGRPLPGSVSRSMRASGKGQPAENTYKLEKEEEAAKKREYNRLYEQEAKHQLAIRQATLKQMHDDEVRQMEALRKVNEEEDRKVAEAHAQAMEEERQYMERLKQSNKRELAARKAEQQAKEARDRQLQELVNENNRHRAEMDERRLKNVTRMLHLQNEQFHREAMLNKKASEAKHYEEVAAIEERNRLLTKEEQEAAQRKKEQFRQEFEDCIARDKEFRRTHNYDEPMEVTRQRNELAAQSYRLVLEEERLQNAERRQQYRKDLMDQIMAKQTYRMTHLDEAGI